MLNFAKFCETKEDFHNIYGLWLEGIDPAVLTDRLISDVDWMLVYKVPRVKGKIKLKHVRRLHETALESTSRDPDQQRVVYFICHSFCIRVLQNNEGIL